MQAAGISLTGVVGGEAPAEGVGLQGDAQWPYLRALVTRTFYDWEKEGRRIPGDRREVLQDCMVAAYLAATTYEGPETLIGIYAQTLTTGRIVQAYATYEEYRRGEPNHTCRGGRVVKRQVVATRLGEGGKPLTVNARNVAARRAVRAILRAEKWRREEGAEILAVDDATLTLDAQGMTLDQELEIRYLIKQFRLWLAEHYPSLPKNEKEAIADLLLRPVGTLGVKARCAALARMRERLLRAGVVLLTPEEEAEVLRRQEAERARDRNRKRGWRAWKEAKEAFREAFGEKTKEAEVAEGKASVKEIRDAEGERVAVVWRQG